MNSANNMGFPLRRYIQFLNHLANKGLIISLEPHPVRYLARGPQELIEKYRRDFGETFSYLKKNLKRLCHLPNREGVITRNIFRRKEIFRKFRELINGTKDNLDLALWREELHFIYAALRKARRRDVNVNIVAYGPLSDRIGTVYHHAASDYPFREGKERRFVLLSDDHKALFANFSQKDSGKAVWTDNKGLVFLVRDFIIHEIYIVKIRKTFPKQIAKVFGANWQKIRLATSYSPNRIR